MEKPYRTRTKQAKTYVDQTKNQNLGSDKTRETPDATKEPKAKIQLKKKKRNEAKQP